MYIYIYIYIYTSTYIYLYLYISISIYLYIYNGRDLPVALDDVLLRCSSGHERYRPLVIRLGHDALDADLGHGWALLQHVDAHLEEPRPDGLGCHV